MTLIRSISGIRGTIGGKAGEGLSPLDVVKYAAAFGAWVKKQNPKSNSPHIVVGRDARISGDMVNNLVLGTLQGLGIDVIDIGLSTTPTVEIAVPEEQADDAGRRCAHERLLVRGLPDRALEVFDVGARGLRVAHADRLVAGRRLAARAARVAEHALGEVRKVDQVPVDKRITRAAETRETVLHVGGVARLAHFAVVDDVDARLGLPAHDVLHRRTHARGERIALHRHALLLGVHHAHQLFGARQAARMRGKETFAAPLHALTSAAA